jgi:hypothetical protein
MISDSMRERANRESDGVIGKAQVEDAAKASLFGSEETRKAKPNPLGTTGAYNGPVNHDGIIVLGRMKFKHHATPPKRQIRQRSFDDDALACVIDGANLCRVLDWDTLIVAARIGLERAEEGGEAMGTELTANGIDGQGTEESVGDSRSRCQFCFRSPALWTARGRHGRTSLP